VVGFDSFLHCAETGTKNLSLTVVCRQKQAENDLHFTISLFNFFRKL